MKDHQEAAVIEGDRKEALSAVTKGATPSAKKV